MKHLTALMLLACTASAALAQTTSTGPAASTGPADFLAGLKAGHPRLILTDDRLAELKKLARTDAVLKRYVEQALAEADGCLDAKPLERKLVGPRLLSVSRECVRRVYALGLAWRWSGDDKYAKALKDNLLTVCAFSDWNPSHFLDTAEMSHAVGVGYDWLYAYLDADARRTIRTKLLELGLEPGLSAYARKATFMTGSHNWNQVCNAGLSIGALAIAEDQGGAARSILSSAVAALPKAIASYDPDGAWGEGPGYWGYATRYTVYGLGAFQTALGTDLGLGDTKGLRQAGYYPLYTAGPTGLFVNYADSGDRAAIGPMPTLFWLARRYGDKALAAAQHKLLEKKPAGPLDVIWYVAAGPDDAANRTLDKKFGGEVELAVLRGAWDDPDALFASIKAGHNQVSHGHLDLGNFEMDALGRRWARDLGSDDYNLPGYWDAKQGGKRWGYYRLGSLSHNVITLDGQHQLATSKAKARMTGFQAGGDMPHAVVDLTGAYVQHVSSARRGLALVGGRRAVLVQDELALDDATDVAWGMTTDAEISADGATAALTLDGKKLTARILSPAGASFSVQSAEQQPPQKPNKGVSRLVINLKRQTGQVRIAVLLSPVWPKDQEVKSADVLPLEKWKQPDAGKP